MQPKIIVSQNRVERDKEIWKILSASQILPNNPDLFILEDEKIGISQIKQAIKHLSTKPFGQTAKSVIILEGSNISPDAQNALLKTLEEPSGNSIIIIGVGSETKLLPTVLSRCLVINLNNALNKSLDFDLDQILNSSIEERFEIIEKATNKELLLTGLTAAFREKVITGESKAEFLDDLLQAQTWKASNVNIRTILEYLMLKLPK